jgi:Golgi apparatus protein 1
MRFLAKTVLLFAGVAVGANAFAQSSDTSGAGKRIAASVEAVKAACAPDLQKYCAAVSPGEGRLLFCTVAHEDKISAECDYALYKTMNDLAWVVDRIGRTADACSAEIEKYCGQAMPGDGEIAMCLKKNEGSLGGVCRRAVNDLSEAGLR